MTRQPRSNAVFYISTLAIEERRNLNSEFPREVKRLTSQDGLCANSDCQLLIIKKCVEALELSCGRDESYGKGQIYLVRALKTRWRSIELLYVYLQFLSFDSFDKKKKCSLKKWYSRFTDWGIVSKGDWLWKLENIKVEYNGAVVYLESSLTVHNPFFCLFANCKWIN